MASPRLESAAASARTQSDAAAGISATHEPQGTCPNGWVARINGLPIRTRSGGVRRYATQDAALKQARKVITTGRAYIAEKATKDGETVFAREVIAGCWDHRNDVAQAIKTVGNI